MVFRIAVARFADGGGFARRLLLHPGERLKLAELGNPCVAKTSYLPQCSYWLGGST